MDITNSPKTQKTLIKIQKEIYNKPDETKIKQQKPKKIKPRKNTLVVMGIQLGDEGKGRIVDNKIEQMLNRKDIKKVYVVRCQGGSNAGHTVAHKDKKIGLHQIPSGIFHEEVDEILDAGMIIHIGDLLQEIKLVNDLLEIDNFNTRLHLAEDAMLCTDLQRAKEVINWEINKNSKGSTGSGIGPTTGGFYDRTGLFVKDLVAKNWQEKLEMHYDLTNKILSSLGHDLSTVQVPDFEQTKSTGKRVYRGVGSKKEFINRLIKEREELLSANIVKDTYHLHQEIYNNKSAGVVFEMAQAVGLDPWLGTKPDTTKTPTTGFGVLYGTRFWRPEDIEEMIGVMKATYMSSVGVRNMPTQQTNEWAKWVREEAHEYGTTTGRPRDVCYLDLPFLLYNLRVSNVTSLGLTHLDICKHDEPLKVCVGYELDGKPVMYKPELEFIESVKPIYIELASWHVDDVMNKSSYADICNEAKLFLKFLSESTGLNIAAVTTGPNRSAYFELF